MRTQVAPVAIGGLVHSGGDRRDLCTKADVELWGVVGRSEATSPPDIQNFVFWPGQSGLQRLDQLGTQYQLWRLKRARLYIAPEAASTLGGARYMGLDYDSADFAPTVPAAIGQMQPSVTGQHWLPDYSMDVTPSKVNRAKWMYTRAGGGVHPGLDAGFKLWVGSTGLTGTVDTGTLFIDYEVEFCNPVQPAVTASAYLFGTGRAMQPSADLPPYAPEYLTPDTLQTLGTGDGSALTVDGTTGVAIGNLDAGRDNCAWNRQDSKVIYVTAQKKLAFDANFGNATTPAITANARGCLFQVMQEAEYYVVGAGDNPLPTVSSVLSGDGVHDVETIMYPTGPGGTSATYVDQFRKFSPTATSENYRLVTACQTFYIWATSESVRNLVISLVLRYTDAIVGSILMPRLRTLIWTPGEVTVSRFLPRISTPFSMPVRYTRVIDHRDDDETTRLNELRIRD